MITVFIACSSTLDNKGTAMIVAAVAGVRALWQVATGSQHFLEDRETRHCESLASKWCGWYGCVKQTTEYQYRAKATPALVSGWPACSSSYGLRALRLGGSVRSTVEVEVVQSWVWVFSIDR